MNDPMRMTKSTTPIENTESGELHGDQPPDWHGVDMQGEQKKVESQGWYLVGWWRENADLGVQVQSLHLVEWWRGNAGRVRKNGGDEKPPSTSG